MIEIIHISDTHSTFPDLPKGDFLIHTGDYSFLPKHGDLSLYEDELLDFSKYLKSMKNNYKSILFTPGNHDMLFERSPGFAESIFKNSGAKLLIDNEVIIDGVKFYGTPSQPPFNAWAFNDDSEKRSIKYKAIPDDVDVLLTHCPPHGILDQVHGNHVGCPILASEIQRIKPNLHCFGHIHEDRGVLSLGETTYSNGAVLDGIYKPTNKYNRIKLDL